MATSQSSSSQPVSAAAILAAAGASSRPSIEVEKEDDLEYDLGHLCARDPAPIDEEAFKADPKAYLLTLARENTQLLTNKLYELLATSDSKTTIRLPEPQFQLPREKPLPQERAITRWERFAKEKGIVKKKRSKMIWDEIKQQWAPRWGFGRANDPKTSMDDWVIEHKPGDDPNVDPFEKKTSEKKMRLDKQKKQEERNRLEAAHAAGMGSLKGNGASAPAPLSKNDRKQYLENSLKAAQISTASYGRFDKEVRGEPSKNKGKRKQLESADDQSHVRKDAERAQKVLGNMFPESKPGAAIVATKAAKQARIAEESKQRREGGPSTKKAKGKPAAALGIKGAKKKGRPTK